MSAKLWKNSVCIAFFLIPTLGKSELTIMKEDPDSASKNWSFVQLILLRIRL